MVSIALTGGIAAGKSLVARRLAQLGATVIDADLLARQVVARGTPGLASVVRDFGPAVVGPDGELDRPALAAVVFADAAARERLNAIIHPLVRAEAARLAAAAGPDAVVVQDIPLLAETGQRAGFDLVLVVEAPERERIRRMVGERGMSEAEGRRRMAAQASDEERRAVADVLIANDGTPAETMAAVDELWRTRIAPLAGR
jgi:dephospho-CoA kinase